MDAPWTPELVLDLDRVRVLVDRDHPDLRGEPLTVVGEGWDNLAVRVGERFVFRSARRELAARLMERELRWMPILAPSLPTAVSAPVRSGGRTADHPFPYGVHPWLPGTTGCRADLTDGERIALAEPLARVLRALHELPVPDDAPPDVLGRGDHRKRGARAVERLSAVPGVDLDRVRAIVEAGVEQAAYAGPPRWVHGDLYGRHVLIGADRGLGGIIDWGDVHVGDPAIDLSIGWSFLPEAGRERLFDACGDVDAGTRVRARLIALDYGGALIPYGRSVGDAPVEALGWYALACATR
jgi:aminoglycoside phosphotransferase (APT) family kinase protein